MFDRENALGFIFLGLCVVVGGVMVYAIVTGNDVRPNVPPIIGGALTILFIGLLLYGMTRNMRGRGQAGRGRAWPDPQAGSRSLWDRLRGRK